MQTTLKRTNGIFAVALVVLVLVGGRCFAPGVPRNSRMASGRARTVMRAASSDAIGEAAAKLSKAAYPFMTQVDWNSPEYWMVPGGDPIKWTKAIGKIIDHGASMDMDLVKAGCEAHHLACGKLPPSGVCSEGELTAINAAIGRMIASVPESKTMGVYHAVSELVDPKVPPYLMSKVKEDDAKAAYEALIEFTKVVKANPIAPSPAPTTVSSEADSSINTAAKELAAASYPFIKGIGWKDELWGKSVPGKSPQETLKAVDSMIVLGKNMDGAALQEAAMAHVKAIERMDENGVLTQEDYEATLAGIGKTIASVRRGLVMNVFDEMSKLVGDTGMPAYVLSKQNPADALASYGAFMNFKDRVSGYQPGSGSGGNAALVLFGFFVFFMAALVKAGGAISIPYLP